MNSKTGSDSNDPIQRFIERWESSGAAERANYQLFLSELCDVIGVPHPDPASPDNTANAYVFERSVTFHHGDGSTSTGFIDLYKRACFVLEAKQGASAQEADGEVLSEAERERRRRLRQGIGQRGTHAWDDAMLRAHGQAQQYARSLPPSEGRPPFLIVVDVGHSIELYSEFTRTGGTYVPFPAPGSHRVFLKDLAQPEIRERLQQVWTTPMDLDPTSRSARVTRDIAVRLARLAVSLEGAGHGAQSVAAFLMRCLFTMFAEDVELLMRDGFTRLLEGLRDTPDHFVPMIEELWQRMNRGGFSTSLRTNVLQFNGSLFEDGSALPLNKDQIQLLIEAAQRDWRDVEPAIFGTLLERALDQVERHKLGAHYTPRAYVERLVIPTIIQPVRAEWESVRAAAVNLATQGEVKKAASEVKKFHKRLCHIRVLDPACGSGNFLYVSLEHLKRIEGEIFDILDSLGERQALLEMAGETVGPHQFLGLEVNPRAAAIAELVLWIGTLQWHFRNHGRVMPPQPIIRNFHNIECRDALIEWDDIEPVLDDDGNPVTRWDGRATKTHPVTGREVPNESERVQVVRYVNPRPADWPEADYIVGNPPFIGPGNMRQALGDGYTETVRKVHKDISSSSDFVMYWWNHAASLAREKNIRSFGFVTTNSLRQKFNRRVLEKHLAAKKPLSLLFAIPDHPWVDSADGAAVRIAMTTATAGEHPGTLQHVTNERESGGDDFDVDLSPKTGKILPDLTIGPDVAGAVPLRANADVSCPGVKLHGSGFIVTPEEAQRLGLGKVEGIEKHIRDYRNGRDLTARPREVMVIDLFGLAAEEARQRFPSVYQWVLERVKPERDQNKRKCYRENWWIFGEARGAFRPALTGLPRYIATVETSKHRFFQFLDESILPDNKLVSIASDDAFVLGVLNSRIHVCWALAAGGHLGVGNDPVYVKTICFEAFPFPEASEEQKDRIRTLAEQLDAHRKRQLAEHSKLTMTAMYNVLDKLRAGDSLTKKEKDVYEWGLVSVLRDLHDDLDTAVFDAYGWPTSLSDEEILERLVSLNIERAAEEARGLIRWLRPEFQNPEGSTKQTEMTVGEAEQSKPKPGKKPRKTPWPKALPDQVRILREALVAHAIPVTAESLARTFVRAHTDRVEDLLQTLVTVGQARQLPDGRYSAM